MRLLFAWLVLAFQAPAVPEAPETHTFYISAAGDDSAAQPDDSDRPYATIAAAWAAARPTITPSGLVSDATILLRRGDTFEGPLPWASGPAPERRFTLGTYGDGARPVVTIGNDSTGRKSWQNVRICGIDFWGRAADPDANPAGFTPIVCKWGGTWWGSAAVNATIEDCRFRFIAVVAQFSDAPHPESRVTFRRCVFLDAYSADASLISNLFTRRLGVTLDSCVFDHGGWSEVVSNGGSTIYEHNAYLSECPATTVQGCVFSRASSIGLKLRSDIEGGMPDLVVRDNLFIEGEVGISVGGNVPGPLRFEQPTIEDNVILYLGRSKPGGRDIAWGITGYGMRGGSIARNVMLAALGNTNQSFLLLTNALEGTIVEDNYCHFPEGIKSPGVVRLEGGELQSPVFRRNVFDVAEGTAFSSAVPPSRVSWRDNWFESPPIPRRVVTAKLQAGVKPTNLAGFLAAVGEPLPVAPDPAADLPLPYEEFITRIREQGQLGEWDESISAGSINARIRSAVGITPAR
jgi:hypothetical protein